MNWKKLFKAILYTLLFFGAIGATIALTTLAINKFGPPGVFAFFIILAFGCVVSFVYGELLNS